MVREAFQSRELVRAVHPANVQLQVGRHADDHPALTPGPPGHFPLASGVNLVPVNAADLLSRVSALNLRGAFTGHYHARIEKRDGNTPLLTNACCSRMRDNHDGSLDEGYLLCSATNDGRLSWEFVEFKPARRATV